MKLVSYLDPITLVFEIGHNVCILTAARGECYMFIFCKAFILCLTQWPLQYLWNLYLSNKHVVLIYN